MMDERDLALNLFDAGLLQFGRFAASGGTRPFQHHFGMLASYPVLLQQVAQGIAARLKGVDRLLCGADCIPLGVAVSLETRLPLVIGRGGGAGGASDLVGAYDIGHPAGLIAHQPGDVSAMLVQHAGRFGLDVREVATILDGASEPLSTASFALLSLPAVVGLLKDEARIPEPLATVVLDWLQAGATRHHPG